MRSADQNMAAYNRPLRPPPRIQRTTGIFLGKITYDQAKISRSFTPRLNFPLEMEF